MKSCRHIPLLIVVLCGMTVLSHLAAQFTPQNIPCFYHHACSFNCQTAKIPGRLDDIEAELAACAVIGLQGTKLKQQDGYPVNYYVGEKYMRFSAGYSRSSNSHAGVALHFARKHFTENNIIALSWPSEPCLQGRGLAVRVKRSLGDFTYITIYIPPEGAAGRRIIAEKLLGWVKKLCQHLPLRTLPVLMMDANAHVGKTKAGANYDNAFIGKMNQKSENANGTLLREFCEDNNIILTNTFVSTPQRFTVGRATPPRTLISSASLFPCGKMARPSNPEFGSAVVTVFNLQTLKKGSIITQSS